MPFKSDAQRKYMFAASERGEIPKKVVEEFADASRGKELPDKVKKAEEEDEKDKTVSKSESIKLLDNLSEKLSKALKASAISGITKRMQLEASVDAYKAGIAQAQPTVGTNRVNDPQEPIAVPVRHVEPDVPVLKGVSYDSCVACGHIHKSLEDCPRCEHLRAANKPAREFWRR